MALSRFHFGKGQGQSYCDGCKAAGAPCATSQPSQCTYNQKAPRTDGGRLAWDFFKANFWRAKLAGMGAVVGVELGQATRALIAAGVAEDDAEDLLAACEMGFLAAVNERDDEGQQ